MYWNSDDYEKMSKLVIDIYADYSISSFPVNEREICRRLGLKLVPYSEYSDKQQAILLKRSHDAFFSPATKTTPPTIFYNDLVDSSGRKRYSIFHEVKHYVNSDKADNDYNDDMADFFARYFMCPIPYLIKFGINDTATLISDHQVSWEAAQNTLRNIQNRRAVYGDIIFDYENPLVDLFSIRF